MKTNLRNEEEIEVPQQMSHKSSRSRKENTEHRGATQEDNAWELSRIGRKFKSWKRKYTSSIKEKKVKIHLNSEISHWK